MKQITARPHALADTPLTYCPGCTHGIAHRLVAEAIDELGIQGRTIGVASVGCSVFAYNFFNLDFQQAAHGRAPAVATGIKRVLPDRVVFTYQGDGDLAAIGTAEIVHAANRGENITVIFVNNAVYGMTGGQMAPTTLVGMRTTTTPFGRDPRLAGHPIRVAELLSSLGGVAYLARVALCGVAQITKAKRAIRRAFQAQLEGQGFSLVEVLSTCPVTWGMQPAEAVHWLEQHMIPAYPLGELITPEKKAAAQPGPSVIPAGTGERA